MISTKARRSRSSSASVPAAATISMPAPWPASSRSHIPGHPTVIVQNMPGAGSLVATRSLDMTQPKDGTVMVTFDPGLITQSLVQPEMVKLDFRRYAWIGITTPNFRVCYGFGPDGVKSWDDMMHRKQFILGAAAKGSGDYVNGATLREVFAAPVKQVLGFPWQRRGTARRRAGRNRRRVRRPEQHSRGLAPRRQGASLRPLHQGETAGDAGKRSFHRGLRHDAGSEGCARRARRRQRGGAVVRDVRGCPRRSARDHAKGLRRHREGSRLSWPR